MARMGYKIGEALWKGHATAVLIELDIPDDAKIVWDVGNPRGRCDKAIVRAIHPIHYPRDVWNRIFVDVQKTVLEDIHFPWAASVYDSTFLYFEGEEVFPADPFDESEVYAKSGIHFFKTKAIAVDYYYGYIKHYSNWDGYGGYSKMEVERK